MFDYSMQDRAIRIIEEGARRALSPRAFIAREIQSFKSSPTYSQMLAGDDYYTGKHDILKKVRTAIGNDGNLIEIDNLPNSQIVDNQYKKAVKQKVNYLVGKPLTVRSDDENYSMALQNFFNRKFHKSLKAITKDSLNCGLGWLYIYYNEHGEFSYKRFRPWEIIPGWKDADHTELDYVIRVYDVIHYNGSTEETLTKVEWYTVEGVDFYEYTSGTVVPCEPWHSDYMNINGNGFNWERLPFVAFKYSEEELPLLTCCKSLQDGLNQILSNFEDTMLEDQRNTILVLVNYDGENLGEFRQNLATYGAVKVRSMDGAKGGVDTLSVEVNADNYKAIADIFRKAIIENCMAYDAKDERMSGTPNQMNIQSMYNDIEMDARDMETEFQASLEDLTWFIDAHLKNTNQGDYFDTDVDYIFDTDMPMDESSTIDNIQKSVGILSTETLISQHPWVTNVESELSKLSEEEENKVDQYSAIIPNPIE